MESTLQWDLLNNCIFMFDNVVISSGIYLKSVLIIIYQDVSLGKKHEHFGTYYFLSIIN